LVESVERAEINSKIKIVAITRWDRKFKKRHKSIIKYNWKSKKRTNLCEKDEPHIRIVNKRVFISAICAEKWI